MALIENLQRDDWKSFLRDCFQFTLDVLSKDRFQRIGSAADDLRSWLVAGGMPRVRERLDKQMKMYRFSPEKEAGINDFLTQLVQENRSKLVSLTTGGVIPISLKENLDAINFSTIDVKNLLNQIMAGERPFEDWMYSHGFTDKDIKEVYHVIDQWLIKHGLIPPFLPPQQLN